MMIVKNYVAPSKIHGVGLFAGENVEKDQIIYVLTPGIDLVMTPDAIEKKAYAVASGLISML
jgi:hypothetical protein